MWRRPRAPPPPPGLLRAAPRAAPARRRGLQPGGTRVAGLAAAAYGGHKDVSEAGVAGALGGGPAAAGLGGAAAPERPEDLQELWQERAALIAADGHVPPAEAERLAGACLVPHDAGG